MSYPDFGKKENGDGLLDFSKFLIYHLILHHSFILLELQLHHPLILLGPIIPIIFIAIIAMVEIIRAKLRLIMSALVQNL
jgi:hypothetical protein